MPLMLAWWFQKREGQLRALDFVVAGVLLVIPVGLIMKQPDLGTSLLVMAGGLSRETQAGHTFGDRQIDHSRLSAGQRMGEDLGEQIVALHALGNEGDRLVIFLRKLTGLTASRERLGLLQLNIEHGLEGAQRVEVMVQLCLVGGAQALHQRLADRRSGERARLDGLRNIVGSDVKIAAIDLQAHDITSLDELSTIAQSLAGIVGQGARE
mgnify:CR=1 FL=1